jgi:hypothetical protein
LFASGKKLCVEPVAAMFLRSKYLPNQSEKPIENVCLFSMSMSYPDDDLPFSKLDVTSDSFTFWHLGEIKCVPKLFLKIYETR